MGTDRKTIYPVPLTLPNPELTDDGKIPKVKIVTYGGVGDGSDGDLNITSGGTVVNSYAGLASDVAANSDALIIDEKGDESLFKIGDELMIIQMQIYRAGYLGRYEFCKIKAINGKNITLDVPVSHDYYSDPDGDKMRNTKTQIVKVPNFNSIVLGTGAYIDAMPWNGYCGGIVCIRCKTSISGGGYITARNRGYRAPWYTWSGEGYMGTAYDGINRSLMGENYGGAGRWGRAGHATVGADRDGSPGRAFGTDDLLNELTFGGGGGGPENTTAGGIIALFAAEISIPAVDVGTDGNGACGSVLIVGADASGVSVTYQPPSSWSYPPSAGFYKNYLNPPPDKIVEYGEVDIPASPIPQATLADVGKTIVPKIVIHGNPEYTKYNGDGSLGDVIINDTQVVNKYAGLSNNGGNDYSAGDTVVTVDSQANIADFSVGDLVMIIQMQVHRSDESHLGLYDITKIKSISGNDIELEDVLTHDYFSDDDGDKPLATKAQIISIPQYNSLTVNGSIEAQAWNGYCGGIAIVSSLGDIIGGGSITTSAKGYRTGTGSRTGGEGYVGYPDPADPKTGLGGAGYGDNYSDGGGHKVRPQYYEYVQSIAYGTPNEDRITMGAGAGHSYNGAGGIGGGAVVVFSGGIVRANISANGGSSDPGDGYIAGPGAGGKVLVFANDLKVAPSARAGREYEQPVLSASDGYVTFVSTNVTQEIVYEYKMIQSDDMEMVAAQLFDGLL